MAAPGLYHFGMSGLEDAIKKKGWSREQLAGQMGVNVNLISRYITAERNIPDARAAQMAGLLDVTPFQIKPNFGEGLTVGLSPKNRRRFLDGMETVFLAEQAERQR